MKFYSERRDHENPTVWAVWEDRCRVASKDANGEEYPAYNLEWFENHAHEFGYVVLSDQQVIEYKLKGII